MSFEFVDHFVYATPDLAGTVDELEKLLGVRPSPGGSHPGMGTANALLSLGSGTYLEVIGPDPDQPGPERPRPFGIDDLKTARLVTWASTSTAIEAQCEKARSADYNPGAIFEMSRKTPDGRLLEWRLTVAPNDTSNGLVPFLIDWGKTEGPSKTLPVEVKLTNFRLTHPEPQKISASLGALGIAFAVVKGKEPRLDIELETADKTIFLS